MHDVASLLAALHGAALVVDDDDRVVAWNDAAVAAVAPAAPAAGTPFEALAGAAGLAPGTSVRLPLREGGALVALQPAGSGATPETAEIQKMRALGMLAGHVAHDLANPLGAIITFSSFLGEEPAMPEELRSSAALLEEEAERSLRIVRAFMEVVRSRAPAPRPVALEPVVRDVLAFEAGLLADVALDVAIPPGFPEVHADPARLRHLLLALTVDVAAALGGSRPRGSLRFDARTAPAPAGEVVELLVDDSAPVVPPGERERLFRLVHEPGDRRTGLHLPVAAHLAALDGGRVRHEPLPEGNRFVVELVPAARLA